MRDTVEKQQMQSGKKGRTFRKLCLARAMCPIAIAPLTYCTADSTVDHKSQSSWKAETPGTASNRKTTAGRLLSVSAIER